MKEQQYVCELARCQNLTKAAQALYITQPALSIFINNLEKSLGVPLFERIGKKFILTYAGERYVEAARKMLEIHDGLEQEFQEITGSYRGRIRLGISTRRSTWFLPPVIAAYERKFPRMEISLETGRTTQLREQLRNLRLDLLICNAADVDLAGMVSHRLYKEKLLVAVPVCHPINERAVYVPGERYRYLDLSCLQGETLILQYKGQSIRSDVDRLLKEKKVVPGRIRELESIETSMEFVAEGLGVGFNREGYIINMTYNKRVNYYGIRSKEDTIDLLLVHRKNLPVTTPVEELIRMLKERADAYYPQPVPAEGPAKGRD